MHLYTTVNDLLSAIGCRELQARKTKSAQESLLYVINAYQKEEKIQARYGGIRIPGAVIQNKIRHVLTNYDMVRDDLTKALVENRIKPDVYYHIRKKLVIACYSLINHLITFFPDEIVIGKTTIAISKVMEYNLKYKDKELLLLV